MKNPYKVFHSPCDQLREKIHICMVRPESGGNVGAAARALANMGILGSFSIVGSPSILNDECKKFARHAAPRLDQIHFFSSLEEAFAANPKRASSLSLAASARIGSARRPHPLRVRKAVPTAIERLKRADIEGLHLVFGPESDGLTNEEIRLCDWVVTIPSSKQYRSLNLAQSVLIFSYEVNMAILEESGPFVSPKPSQKEKLIAHFVRLAEEVQFILPGDPFKMKPRLEEILSSLPNHIEGVRTLHGLMDQIRRTVQKGHVDLKGRFKHAHIAR